MSEMRRATWSGLEGRLVLRRPQRLVAVAKPGYVVEAKEPIEPPLATLPLIPDAES
jgi:hypothetical protein